MNHSSEPFAAATGAAGGENRPDQEKRPDQHTAIPQPSAIPAESSTSAQSALERFRHGVAAKQTAPGEIETEQSLWQGGYSAQAMGGVWVSAALLSAALIVAALLYDALPLWIALALAAAAWVVALLVYAARRLGIHYELTTQRFIHQHGILSRRTERIEVIEIEDISFYQGPIQRILGIGTIDITSTDRSHPHLIMPGIAEVKTVAGLIDDVRRRERKRRSLHIRSM